MAHFRPTYDPARRLYDAILGAAQNHPDDDKAQDEVVWACARDYAQQHGLRVPTLKEVNDASVAGMGHVDAAAKWAYKLAAQLGG